MSDADQAEIIDLAKAVASGSPLGRQIRAEANRARVEELSSELIAELAKPIDLKTVPVRFSALKQIELSPLHYWWACQDSFEPTLAMRLGLGGHAMLFDQPWITFRGRRAGKKWDEFEQEHQDRVILNERETAEAKAMADAVRSNRVAARVLEGATFEKTIHWSYQGRACRSTPDIASVLHIGDLKCVQSSEPKKFQRDAFFRRYHGQVVFYDAAMRAAGVGDPQDLYLVAVESSAPYPTTVLRISDRARQHGETLWQQWFQRVLECEAEGKWPGYSDQVLTFDLTD